MVVGHGVTVLPSWVCCLALLGFAATACGSKQAGDEGSQDAGNPRAHDASPDAGGHSNAAFDGSPDGAELAKAEAGSSVDSGGEAPPTSGCVPDGLPALRPGMPDPCCASDWQADPGAATTDAGRPGHCKGCVAEGADCLSEVPCCAQLACTGPSGQCGTSACSPDLTPCGGGSGTVCCNDNCNGSVCGGS
jgi:hypothetical protein